jgi:hypothetical protein
MRIGNYKTKAREERKTRENPRAFGWIVLLQNSQPIRENVLSCLSRDRLSAAVYHELNQHTILLFGPQ